MLLTGLKLALGLDEKETGVLAAWLAERDTPVTIAALFAALSELAARGEAA